MFIVLTSFSGSASAQYKNFAIQLDTAGSYWTKGAVTDDSDVLLAPDNRGLRLSHEFRIGVQSQFKLDGDKWWFVNRFDIGAILAGTGDNSTNEGRYEAAVNETIGTLIFLKGGAGIKYYFLTDQNRPFITLYGAYTRLFNLSSTAEQLCSNSATCGESGVGSTNAQNFFVHPNLVSAGLQLGTEIIVKHDLALVLFLEPEYTVVFNAEDSFRLSAGIGLTFFM